MKQANLVLTDGGLGDMLGELVAVDWLIRNRKDVQFQVWVPDYIVDITLHLLSPRGVVRGFSKAKTKFKTTIPTRSTQWTQYHTCMRTHPVDYGFHVLADMHMYDQAEKQYLKLKPEKIGVSRFKLPKNYVVLQATAAEAVKMMPYATFFGVAEWLIEHGYHPVYVGKSISYNLTVDSLHDKTITKPKGLEHPTTELRGGTNLVNKTSLLELGAVIAGAELFVGMDGGIAHLAGCTDTPILAGYTLVDPVHVRPIRQEGGFHAVEPDLDVPNRYYQTYWSMFEQGDFRVFPGWEKSVESMTAEKFIVQLHNCLTIKK